ncbi:MAG: hypothetical protein AAF437_09795 [Pseudomonadota bacterium]
MIGWPRKQRARQVFGIGLIVLVHLIVIVGVMSIRWEVPRPDQTDLIEIVFATEEAPDPVEEIAEADAGLERRNIRAEVASLEAATPEAPRIASDLAQRGAEIRPQTLTADDPRSNAAAAEMAVIPPDRLAAVLQQLDCQRFSSEREDRCETGDPFAVAAASMARQTAAPQAPILMGDFGPKTLLEGFMSQKDRDPYLMPGMSADLFTEGMAKGSYNAQRIRNGKAPIWDDEIERALRRTD